MYVSNGYITKHYKNKALKRERTKMLKQNHKYDQTQSRSNAENWNMTPGKNKTLRDLFSSDAVNWVLSNLFFCVSVPYCISETLSSKLITFLNCTSIRIKYIMVLDASGVSLIIYHTVETSTSLQNRKSDHSLNFSVCVHIYTSHLFYPKQSAPLYSYRTVHSVRHALDEQDTSKQLQASQQPQTFCWQTNLRPRNQILWELNASESKRFDADFHINKLQELKLNVWAIFRKG